MNITLLQVIGWLVQKLQSATVRWQKKTLIPV